MLLATGFGISCVLLFTSQKPLILPFETGFQIAFAAISQDIGRVFLGFFFGSGWGTFSTDFTRFKLATFNQNAQLWTVVFGQSSSFLLELLTTTGILGLLSFLFLGFRIIKYVKPLGQNPFSLAIIIALICMVFLPFGYVSFALLFFLLGFFVTSIGFLTPKNISDMEQHTIALKKHEPDESQAQRNASTILSSIFFLSIIVIVGCLGYFGTLFLLSDTAFESAAVAAAQNQGEPTYQKQLQAIQLFPYRDLYFRSFAQTNFAFASSIASSHTKDKPLSAQQQQTMYALIQQSLTSARTATTLAPLTVSNWQMLSSLYRSLIGFGQNAEQFAISTGQQAIALDPTNPQEYIYLGGIYYQLGQYDLAIQQFQTAANLKPDFANAYYNWGHALQMKGDLQNALPAYQQVKSLVGNNQTELKVINADIDTVQKGITVAKNQQTQSVPIISPPPTEKTPKAAEAPLQMSSSSAILPTQRPRKEIPAPSHAP